MLLNAIDAGNAGVLEAMLSTLSIEHKKQLMHDKDAVIMFLLLFIYMNYTVNQ